MSALLDCEALRRAVDGGVRPRFRYFWGHRARADGGLGDGCFSQWWPCDFEVQGQAYRSAEHFMMAGKARLFGDADVLQQVLAAPEPAEAKALGRKVRGFTEEAWAAVRFELVTAGNVAKFGQDAALRAYLLDTGEDVLVEASPTDRVWGIGLERDDERARSPQQWRGLNLLGFALMRTRAILRGELPAPELSPQLLG